MEQVDRRQILNVRLHGIERREHPRRPAGAAVGLPRHQGIRALGNMQENGAGLEQYQSVLFIGRDLAKRLHRAIAGGLLIFRPDQARLIRQARFFQRPAYAQIAHQSAREVRYPAKCAYFDHCYVPSDCSSGEIFFDYRSRYFSSLTSALSQPWLWLSRAASSANCSWVSVSSVPSPSFLKVTVTSVSRSGEGVPPQV